jgi:hypothetical protein
MNSPWAFDKSLVLLQAFDGEKKVADQFMFLLRKGIRGQIWNNKEDMGSLAG